MKETFCNIRNYCLIYFFGMFVVFLISLNKTFFETNYNLIKEVCHSWGNAGIDCVIISLLNQILRTNRKENNEGN